MPPPDNSVAIHDAKAASRSLRRWQYPLSPGQFRLATLFVLVFAVSLALAAWKRWRDQQAPLTLSPTPTEDATGYPAHFVRAVNALEYKRVRPGMSVEQLFAISAPDSLVTLGTFTRCFFTGVLGYEYVIVVAKNGRIVQAIRSGCTGEDAYFDTMTENDRTLYEQSLEAHYAAQEQFTVQQ